MFNNPSPLIYTRNGYQRMDNYQSWNNQNPQEVELMMKQKFQQNVPQNLQQINLQTDPYLELQNELLNCSALVKNKIIADPEYQICDTECELLIKQAIEEVFVPQILNTPKGRIVMEKFVGVVKQLKEKYSNEEIHTNEQLKMLLNDEVVRKRMQQLSQDKVATQTDGDK